MKKQHNHVRQVKMDAQFLISKWRSVCRSLWNETYMEAIINQGGSFELEENFAVVERLLFDAIVLYRLDDETSEEDQIGDHMAPAPPVLERFRIVPRGESMPVMVNREKISGYWDHPIRELKKNQAEIGFVHCYDFSGMDMPRRYEYLRGRILECPEHPEIEGKEILIPADLAWIEYRKRAEPAV